MISSPPIDELVLDNDRLLPTNRVARVIARRLLDTVEGLPIISPHGHTDPSWFANNGRFDDAHSLIVAPDHYVLRMLFSQGISLEELGVAATGGGTPTDSRAAWRLFAKHFFLFRGTPSEYWLNHVFVKQFGLSVPLSESTADDYYDRIGEKLRGDGFRPRALYDRFDIEFLATTESPHQSLEYHRIIQDSEWSGSVVTTYRPDPVVDPYNPNFHACLEEFGKRSGFDPFSWSGYLDAHRARRSHFRDVGATATDHGHATPATANLSLHDSEALFSRVLSNQVSKQDAELFRAQMLTEMAKMSLDDKLVMQLHPGSFRNHNSQLFETHGPDKGADIPFRVEYTQALKPLLDIVGNDRSFNLILFTLDESNYSRELAPLAGHYPCLKLGPAWWFHDSPDGMRRYREQTTETAGFYNTVGFNDDTRALMSIPARHDMARRVDCGYLANLVVQGRLREGDASQVAKDLAYNLPKQNYRVGQDAS